MINFLKKWFRPERFFVCLYFFAGNLGEVSGQEAIGQMAATAEQPNPSVSPKIRTVVLDAGHGGHDPGCLGLESKEKDIALQITLKVGALIETYLPDVKVVYTRKTDKFVKLFERSEMANRTNADLFISIHCNASKNPKVFGTETYVMGLHVSDQNFQIAMRENGVIFHEDNYNHNYAGFDPYSPVSYILLSNYQQSHQKNSLELAAAIEKQFAEKYKKTSRGVKQAGFWVLARTTMPGVLVETGFLSNPQDEAYLNSPIGQMEIAASVYRAFRNYKQLIEEKSYSY